MACNSFAIRILPIFCVIKSNKITLSSPRSWGCFSTALQESGTGSVFPTLVGVFRQRGDNVRAMKGLPHARGGVSEGGCSSTAVDLSSPRSWGCFQFVIDLAVQLIVFPTLVGVFPGRRAHRGRPAGLPHARGGVSTGSAKLLKPVPSSPRSWGCFCVCGMAGRANGVFPTLVGVFLLQRRPQQISHRLPHARGGVSQLSWYSPRVHRSSPRSWGCFFGV